MGLFYFTKIFHGPCCICLSRPAPLRRASRPFAAHARAGVGRRLFRQGRLGAITLIGHRQGQLQQRHRESALGCDSQRPCPPMDVGLSRRRAQSCGHSARLRIRYLADKPKRFLSDSGPPQRPELLVCTASRRQVLSTQPAFCGWRLFARRGPARARPLAWAPRCE